jgi:hypothetical protein
VSGVSHFRLRVLHVVLEVCQCQQQPLVFCQKLPNELANLILKLACLQLFVAYPGSAFNCFQPGQQRAMMQRRSGSLGVSPIHNSCVAEAALQTNCGSELSLLVTDV